MIESVGAFPVGNPSTLPFLSPGHAIFKLTYLSNHDYKHLYFESDAATVNEIMLKVSVLGPGTRCRDGVCWMVLRPGGSPSPLHTGQGLGPSFAEEEPSR